MKKIKAPWDYSQPPIDERSSCYVNAGNHHGVGYRQPTGTFKHKSFDAIPQHCHHASLNPPKHENLKIELDQ